MGRGHYSHEAHARLLESRAGVEAEALFSGAMDPRMDPKGVVRESRDSANHPESVGIVFALDVSASMEELPHQLAKETLPAFMEAVRGVLPDAQVCFMAFGNAYSDQAPLQVGQFESTGELMDQWLKAVWIESGGGGMGESFDLAMLFAARHMRMDCFEKRQKKGYLFLTGDEIPFIHLGAHAIRRVLGDSDDENRMAEQVAAEALERFHVFFLIPDPVRAEVCESSWRWLLGERVLVLPRPAAAAVGAALVVAITEGVVRTDAALEAWLDKYAPEHPELLPGLSELLQRTVNEGFVAPRALTLVDHPGFKG